MRAFWNDFGPFIFLQDRGGSLYFGGSRFAKSITSKLIKTSSDIDLIQWNYGEIFQNKVAEILPFYSN